MADVSFSTDAAQDLETYFYRSLDNFGQKRTDRYFDELDRELERLAEGYRLTVVPVMGIPDLLRYRYMKHYIFFVPSAHGIFVSRVVHTSRLHTAQPYPLPTQQ